MKERVRLCLKAIDDAMINREFLLDFGFSAADINLGYSLHLSNKYVNYDDLVNAKAYYERLVARPAFQRSII